MTQLVSTNPADGYAEIGSVTISFEKEIIEKVQKAHAAFPAWKKLPLEKRLGYFKKLLNVYARRTDEVAELQTREVGKPITQSREDVAGDLHNIENKIELATECLTSQVLDITKTGKTVLYREPYGVAAVICPWNYPSSNFFISTLQLLIAGNTVVFKHSEECPLTGELLADIMDEAGFPTGVFSEIYGDGKVGDFLTDQDINIIHFTGSSKVGQHLYQKAARKFIPAILEMGGSSPGIIFPGADLRDTCSSVCIERFSNCGQICCALKRLIVHESMYDDVVAMMKKNIQSYVVGDPMNPKTTIGPLVAKRQLVLLEEQVKDAITKGAKVIIGEGRVKGLNGAFYQPTLLTDVTPDMRVMTEEVFGPVLPVVSFATTEEAIHIANKTPYGLSAFLYGTDVKELHEVASEIQAGQISMNGATYFTKHAPFGGYKLSGLGRNDGRVGFFESTRIKVVAEPV